jgi:hypothetical protein
MSMSTSCESYLAASTASSTFSESTVCICQIVDLLHPFQYIDLQPLDVGRRQTSELAPISKQERVSTCAIWSPKMFVLPPAPARPVGRARGGSSNPPPRATTTAAATEHWRVSGPWVPWDGRPRPRAACRWGSVSPRRVPGFLLKGDRRTGEGLGCSICI